MTNSLPITKEQLLTRIYHNAKGRIKGKTTRPRTRHLYKGLPIMPKDDFVTWGLKNPVFKRLFKNWELTGYDIRFVPSPDRLDARKGYVVGNMEWVPFSENCRRGHKTGHKTKLSEKELFEKIKFEVNRFANRINEIRL